MEYRDGVDKAEEEWASVKVIPSWVRLSMLGVGILDYGLNAEMSPYPKSSANINITLGDCALTTAVASNADERVISLCMFF